MRLLWYVIRCLDCRQGGIAVSTAIVFPILFSIAAVGIEISSWYLKQRAMQGAADAAAISAAAAYLAGGDPIAEGTTYAGLNGWTDGEDDVSVVIAPTPTA